MPGIVRSRETDGSDFVFFPHHLPAAAAHVDDRSGPTVE
jgi:hypothetical protein